MRRFRRNRVMKKKPFDPAAININCPAGHDAEPHRKVAQQ
jgi:hypothetical protein